MAFNNLKSLKLQEITGSQLAQVGDIFTDTSSRSDFEQMKLIKEAVINSKTFTGGLPFPDSVILFSKSVSSDTATIKPSDIYPNDLDSDKYLVQVIGYAMTANDASASITINLTDGATTLPLVSAQRAFDLTSQYGLGFRNPLIISENTYLSFVESGGYTVNLIGLYGIVARGGV